MYKYQMHTHTAPTSHCAVMKPDELSEALYRGGYSGCVITNHFYIGKNQNLPWKSLVSLYEDDYNKCKVAAEKYDLDILFGIEVHLYDGLEILCYGITPKFLYNNPQLKENSLKLWYDTLHSVGALVIQSHPFRKRDYIKCPQILPLEYIDGIEVFNYSNNPGANDIAEEYYSQHQNLIVTSSSDAHVSCLVCVAGIETNIRLKDEKTLTSVLKNGEYLLIE